MVEGREACGRWVEAVLIVAREAILWFMEASRVEVVSRR
jgi:hypothetical protein